MKVSEAEKLVCPFMQNSILTMVGEIAEVEQMGNIKCITNKCMAWINTTPKSKEPIDGEVYLPYIGDGLGYCQRLKDD